MLKDEKDRIRKFAAERESLIAGETIPPSDVLVSQAEQATAVQEKLGGVSIQWARSLVKKWGAEEWYGVVDAGTYTLTSSSDHRVAQHIDESAERVAETSRRNGMLGGRPIKDG